MGTMETNEAFKKLRDELERTGLIPSEFMEWNGILYLWADASYQGKTFAKYIFTYSDYENWCTRLYGNTSFTEEIIEPIYFSLADDLCWNLYWVSLLEQTEFEKVSLQERTEHESNTEFTRNFVFSSQEMKDRLPIGKVKTESTKEFDTPGEDWLKNLAADGNEFCLKEFKNDIWNQFVKSGKKFPCGNIPLSPSDGSNKHEKILKLLNIKMPTSFRPHCYEKNWDTSFASVNLLDGPNGSGKTSILHAIELAMTGEIRQKREAEPSVDNAQVILSAAFSGDKELKNISKPCSTSDKKDREKHWYMSRAASNNRSGDKLNEVFHRYNFVSVDDPFLFTTGQPNYQGVFSTLLYGPDTENQWKSITRYLENCRKKVKELEDKLSETTQELESIHRTGEEQVLNWQQYLPQTAIYYSEADSPKIIMDRTARILAAYSAAAADEPVISQQETHQMFDNTKKQLEQAVSKVERAEADYQALMLRCKELNEVNLRYRQELIKVDGLTNRLRPITEMQTELNFFSAHEQEIESYQMSINKKAELDPDYEKLALYFEKYKDLEEVDQYLPQGEIRNQIEQNKTRKLSLESRLKMVQEEVKQLEAANSQYKQAQAYFRSSSESLLALQREIHECPMCGTQNITKEMIFSHLNHEKDAAGEELKERYTRLGLLNKELEDENHLYDQLKKQLEQSRKIQEAADAAKHAGYSDSIETLPRIRQAIKKYREILQRKDKIEQDIKDRKKLLLRSYQSVSENTDLEVALTAPERTRKILSENGYTPPASPKTVELQSYVSEIFAKLSEKKQQTEIKSEECTAALQSIPLDTSMENWEHTLQEKKRLDSESERLCRVKQFWEGIRTELRCTNVSGKTIETQCLHINQLLSVEQTLQEIRNRKQQLQEQQKTFREQCCRCREFQVQLEKLQEPEKYALRFIQENIEEISSLFLSLHAPREFCRLGLNEKDCLVGYREEDEVPLQQMSTGQKTAVVLAVFFRMHLTNPAAPDFLLLDEPVSNTDDLNVLSLLDLLRELAISHHTQIFMTTANRNIAKLFRRKFSFLGPEFQELSFKREKNLQSAVIRRTYNQKKVASEKRIL